ncbi:ATP-binding protein [Sphaerisporangium viridialbum]|uniref:ATP-binding protein n=1 Tax=Sphaerisporangium viridialbum TaxID=46189 RepID=UPI003C7259F3
MSTPALRTETAAFPATEASVGEARRWLSKILDWQACCDDAVWLLSEAATNSVAHTDSAVVGVTVVVEENGDVRVEVADEGAQTIPSIPLHPDDDLAASGRGIRLIRALSSLGFHRGAPPLRPVVRPVPTRPGQGMRCRIVAFPQPYSRRWHVTSCRDGKGPPRLTTPVGAGLMSGPGQRFSCRTFRTKLPRAERPFP